MARRLLANPIKQLVSQELKKSDFTDGGETSGFIDFLASRGLQLPAGSIVQGVKIKTSVGFTGNVSAVVTVGKAGAVNDYAAVTTKSVFAAGTKLTDAPQLTAEVEALTTPRVTVTSATDFTLIAAGAKMVVTIYYLDTNAKAI